MTEDWRLLITGSRYIVDRTVVRQRLFVKLGDAIARQRTLVLVHGDCPDQNGADRTAHIWGQAQMRSGQPVRVEAHPAKGHPTENFGEWPQAGPNRNTFMVGLGADEGIAFLDRCTSLRCRRPDAHPSHGTSDCLRKAVAAGIPMETVELWREF